ncbi:MAG: hypothetical protein QXX56_03385 [Candidatus Bathyarchaeia archaeon]
MAGDIERIMERLEKEGVVWIETSGNLIRLKKEGVRIIMESYWAAV